MFKHFQLLELPIIQSQQEHGLCEFNFGLEVEVEDLEEREQQELCAAEVGEADLDRLLIFGLMQAPLEQLKL
jgi:hypothetical protein